MPAKWTRPRIRLSSPRRSAAHVLSSRERPARRAQRAISLQARAFRSGDGAKSGCKKPDLSHPFLKIALALYIAWGGWHWLATRPVHPPDGVLALEDPLQVELDHGAQIHMGRWKLTERATDQ